MIKSIGIIGFGNMAEAIVAGLLTTKQLNPNQIIVLDLNPCRQRLAKRGYKLRLASSINELCDKTATILLAVKPQQMVEVLPSLRAQLKNHLVISIAAGLPLSLYKKHLGSGVRLIRVMPNTPALVGFGMTAYVANNRCSKKDCSVCEKIFGGVGHVVLLKNESKMNVVTAVSGCGPAFVYQYAAACIKAAKKMGLGETLSRELVLGTMIGATQMMLAHTESPDELTARVASKKGSTQAGLNVLEKMGFAKIMGLCLEQARVRAEEMSVEYGKTPHVKSKKSCSTKEVQNA